MRAIDAGWFHFTDVLLDGSSVKCVECGEWRALAEWSEAKVFCEECGTHPAMRCPACDRAFDGVYDSKCFEVRNG